MADLEKFELDTICDKEHGVLEIANGFEKTLALVKKILEDHPVPSITNDTEKKIAKETRANLNKCIKAIDRRRIDSIADFTSQFTENCNALKELFDERQKAFGEVIKAYEDSQKVVVGEEVTATKKYVATIKFYDEKLVKKLTDFCTKNGCELSIK